MATSTNAHRPPRGVRLSLQAIALLAILALGCTWPIAIARADGDPASDVLATQKLFLPQDAASRPREQAQLGALLQEATRSGYRIRVALIGSQTDLGSVTELWRQPQTYARFLGQELSLVYRGALLVVMPNGYGTYGFTARAVVRRQSLPAPGAAGGLAPAALSAIRALAAASGHPLPMPTIGQAPTASSGETTGWIAFGIGVILVLAAWTASLRARPPHIGHSTSTSA